MSVNWRVAVVVITLLGGTSCVLFSTMCNLMMIGEINRRKTDAEQMSYFGYYPEKQIRIIQDYRRLYPKGRLHLAMLGSFFLGLGLLVVFILLLGILFR